MQTTKSTTTTPSIQSNQWVGVIVLLALAFLVLVRMGFRGLVVTV